MSFIPKINSPAVDKARRLINICRHLNFAAIVRHDPLAVAQLQQAIHTLGIGKGSLFDTAHSIHVATTKSKVSSAQKEIGSDVKSTLEEAGFGDRLGKIYHSESKVRIVPFDNVPHRSGLPAFLFVISPDFAPVAGFHGIFVTATDVYAAILPANGRGVWEIDARRSYATVHQMIEWVTLLSAGFALP